MKVRNRETGEVFEAWQVIAFDEKSKIPGWIFKAFVVDAITDTLYEPSSLYVHTLRGTRIARIGDYVIKGVEGELYPISKDIFEKTYEVVE